MVCQKKGKVKELLFHQPGLTKTIIYSIYRFDIYILKLIDMAYNEEIAQKIRNQLSHLDNVQEKRMFGGICFMLDDKMCIGVNGDEIMCRIDPLQYDEALTKKGTRKMDFTGREMKGYVFVNEDGIRYDKDFSYWVSLCVEFNKIAKSSKKKMKTKRKDNN